MRRTVKRLVELALLYGGPAAASRRRIRRSALIIAYHNVVPQGEAGGADQSLHLPQAHFAHQLDHLASCCEVVPLPDLISGRTPSDRPLAAITFDDGYIGALSAGVEELVSRGLPATFFITPGCLEGHAFWWDSYVEQDGGPLRTATRDYLVEELGGRDEAIRAWAASHLRLVPVPLAARAAGLDLVRQVARLSGMSFGAHTWSHPNLARLESVALDQELRKPLGWITDQFHSATPVVAFPYGRYSETVMRAAASMGYRAGLAITGGWMRQPAPAGPVLPRLNVSSGLSLPGFALRLAGMLA